MVNNPSLKKVTMWSPNPTELARLVEMMAGATRGDSQTQQAIAKVYSHAQVLILLYSN